MVKFLKDHGQESRNEMRQKFELDARIHDARTAYDKLVKDGKEAPPSPFAQRISAGTSV